MNIKPLCHCFCFIPMLNKELLSLEWVTKDPTCVVGEQRQFFHLALCLPELACDVGDTSKWEWFKSSKLNSAIFIFRFISLGWSLEAFAPHFHPYFVYCNLEKNIRNYKSNEQLQKLLKMDSYMFIWHVTSCNFLWYHKLFFMVRLFTNLTCRWNRKICFDWFREWVVQMKFCYKISQMIAQALLALFQQA